MRDRYAEDFLSYTRNQSIIPVACRSAELRGKGHTTRIVSKGESLVFGVALVDARSE